MTKVKALEREIESLSPKERAALRDWLLESDWKDWDRQTERDAVAGKLDRLFKRALKDHKAGKSKTL